MTGAPLPPGADAVVPIEWTRTEGDAVVIDRGVAAGQHVAPRAEDLRAGQPVARAGEEVTALSLSLLIGGGAAEVEVVRRPRVALLTSGNELVPPGAPLQRGQIRESNGRRSPRCWRRPAPRCWRWAWRATRAPTSTGCWRAPTRPTSSC